MNNNYNIEATVNSLVKEYENHIIEKLTGDNIFLNQMIIDMLKEAYKQGLKDMAEQLKQQ